MIGCCGALRYSAPGGSLAGSSPQPSDDIDGYRTTGDDAGGVAPFAKRWVKFKGARMRAPGRLPRTECSPGGA
jgi:hypothetical protein